MPYAAIQRKHDEMLEEGVQFGKWDYDLLAAPCNNPVGCCYGFCCIACFAYQQRDRILKHTNTPYAPCGGSYCCCPTPEIDDSPQRECCMCCEACCCPYVAVLTNRDLIMYLYQVDYDKCDEFIITCVICLDCIFSILAIIDDSFRELRDIIDLLLMVIMSCSLAQQESKLDVVTGQPTLLGGNFAGEYQKPNPVSVEQTTYAQQPNYGQPAVNYGQPNYGQPAYGAQPNYGAPVQAQPYGAPVQAQPNYGAQQGYGGNTGFA